MSESIAHRVGRIVAGSFNVLVDAVENAVPETVMDQAIREIDQSIDEIRVELGLVIANKHLASNRLMEENRKHEEISANIKTAIEEDRDDLAEAAIALQMDLEAQIPVLEAAITDAGQQERELEGYIRALQAKKREMVVELDNYKASREQVGGSDGPAGASSSTEVKVDKAGEAFDRVMRANTGLPAQQGVQDRQGSAQLAELDDLARNNRVKERLAQIKAETS